MIQRSLTGVVSGIANSYPCRCIGLRHLSGLLSSSEIVLEADELDIEKYRKRILGIDPAISGKCKHDHAFPFLPELTNRGALQKQSSPMKNREKIGGGDNHIAVQINGLNCEMPIMPPQIPPNRFGSLTD